MKINGSYFYYVYKKVYIFEKYYAMLSFTCLHSQNAYLLQTR